MALTGGPTLRETAGEGADALLIPTDVGVAESVAALFGAVCERWGRVDLLVNNPGTFGPAGAVDELSPADWDDVVRTNLTGGYGGLTWPDGPGGPTPGELAVPA